MQTKPPIDIVLSTYNGEKHLREQLDSIIAQTFSDWRLIIRDDGSVDETVAMVRHYADRYPGRVKVIGDDGKNLGARTSYSLLMGHSDAEYIMFSDQDDVWLPDKVALTFRKMKDLEARHGKEMPLLVFTDVRVADENLCILAESLWTFQKSDPEKGRFLNRLLMMNPANGCTMMINRMLRDRAFPVPPEALMHDSWLILVAAAFGEIGYLSDPTLLYRLHGRNESGARQWGPRYVFRRLCDLRIARDAIAGTQRQAGALYDRYHDTLKDPDREMLSAYAHLHERNFFRRRFDILRYGFFYKGIARNIGWLLLC